MTAADAPTPYEQGLARGAEIVAAKPLPAEVAERLALLLRPAMRTADRSTHRAGRRSA